MNIEPKQETLEEAADNYGFQVPYNGTNEFYDISKINSFIAGAKWQQAQDKNKYSEEDLISFAYFYFTEEFNSSMQTSKKTKDIFTEWFEQFKKK